MGLKKLTVLFLSVVTILISSKVVCEEVKTGLYNTAAVNLRTQPSIKSISLGLVNENATCQILNEQLIGKKHWYRVKITSDTVNQNNLKNRIGWSQARYIDLTESTSSSNFKTGEKSVTRDFTEIVNSMNASNLDNSSFAEESVMSTLD